MAIIWHIMCISAAQLGVVVNEFWGLLPGAGVSGMTHHGSSIASARESPVAP